MVPTRAFILATILPLHEASDDQRGNGRRLLGLRFLGATAVGQALQMSVTGAGEVALTAATAADGDTFAISDVVISRGLHKDLAVEDITTRTTANDALGVLDTAIENVNSTRATLGASMSRLEYAADNLQNVSQNSSAARSRVLDADYASRNN